MNTKEYIKRVMEENNKKLIEYIENLISDINLSGEDTSIPEEIDIEKTIQDDKDWIVDDIIDIELAIQQDKTWNIIINDDIKQFINQDKNWEVSQ